jgi:glycine dehydrogenase
MENRARRAEFLDRHLGPRADEVSEMLRVLGVASLDELVTQTVPASIRSQAALKLPAAATEREALAELRGKVRKNRVLRSYLGMGYADCIVPAVIQRNILENPGWYTQYTPYQAEIAQGRLEALLNFQTLVSDLTGLEVANASLLDEGTAAAEAMALCLATAAQKNPAAPRAFLVSDACHPQTIDILRTRASAIGVGIEVANLEKTSDLSKYFGALIQYPETGGRVVDPRAWVARAKAAGSW